MRDLLEKIWKEIKPAYIEIASVITLIDALVSSQEMVDLSNMLHKEQITIWWFLIIFNFQFILVPALPSIIIGWVIHKIRNGLKKKRGR